MAVTKILLDCTDQNLIVTEVPVIASGGINDNKLVITFSAHWDGLAKSAIFFTSNYKTVYEVVLTNNEGTIPAEVLTEPGTLYIGVRGVNSGGVIVKTSSLVKFKIVPGAPPADGTTVEPTADVYQQLLTAYGKNENAIAVERSRIDALVKLENGSTTGDAELQDIRIGADGLTRNTAGDAVREQMKLVETAINTRVNEIRDIWKETNNTNVLANCVWEDDVGLNTSNGKKLPNNAAGYRCISHLVPVLPNDKYETTAYAIVCEYDLFGAFLVGHSFAPTDDLFFTTTENTAYVLCAQRPGATVPYLKRMEKNLIKKRLSILGDSYSTYGGFVTPETNRCFYNGENESEDTNDVSDMWWYRLIENNGFMLETNNSFSGSPICNTGYDGSDASNFSFLNRMKNIGRPDVITVFGGTNDSWANVPIGEYKYSYWTENDFKNFRPAFAYMCEYLQKHNPNANIYVIINSGLSEEITSSMITISNHYGITVVELPTFDKPYGGHPGRAGQKAIYEAVKDTIV